VLSVIGYDSEDEAIRIANDLNMVSTRPSLGPTSSALVASLRRYGQGASSSTI
jgi:acyl-CoA reductase-like NAD-dependent aldehyde dehydrogenase